jgi:RHS repeat-associated protein
MRIQRLAFFVGFWLSLSLTSPGQQSHLNHARGFNANQIYATHQIDSVNVFNGNLVLGIPVGGTYRVGGNLSYSLRLFYNSNIWTFSEVSSGIVSTNYNYMTVWVSRMQNNDRLGSYDGATWSVERFIPNDSEDPRSSVTDHSYTAAFPNGNANAGMGWQLTLGALFEPRWAVESFDPQTTDGRYWVYQAPDGSEHQFYPTLHEDDPRVPADENPATDPVTYTRDGSYLRMKVVDASTRTVEFPDGQVHTLKNLAPPPQGNIRFSPSWRVTQMRDQFGNAVNVTYNIQRDGNQEVMAEQWHISDGLRTNTISLARFPETPEYGPVIRTIDLAAFGGARAFYHFEYEVRNIRRAWPNVEDSPYIDVNVNVPFLSSVKQPDESRYSMGPVDDAYDVLGENAGPQYRGVLRKLTLPTGARLEWDYKPETPDPLGYNYGYVYPTMSTGRHYLRRARGVRRRLLIEGGNTYEWRYDPQLEEQPAGCSFTSTTPECGHKLFRSRVTTPQGDYTVHYFSVFPFPHDSDVGRQPADWHVAEYGLPLRKDVSQTAEDGAPVFLSSEVYRKNANSTHTKIRETYVRYETDKLTQRDPWGAVVANDRRMVVTRTVYLDDFRDGGVKYTEMKYSDFDGLGHLRRVETQGNFAASDYRLEVTNYNEDRGGYLIDPATNQPVAGAHTYTPLPESSPWVLGNYGYKLQREGNSTAMQQYNFHPSGQLRRKRVLRANGGTGDPSVSTSDVLIVYGYDADGTLTSEDYYGGDKQNNVGNGALTGTLPAASEYRINHFYEHKTLKQSQYRNSNFFTYDVDIDAPTGLARRSRDASKLTTDYSYDAMGRPTQIRPASGARTDITYHPVLGGQTGGVPRAVVVHKTNNGATVLDEEHYEFDNMGRVKVEKKKMPGGTFIARRTLYDGQGWLASQSEWHQDGAGFPHETRYLDYDPFGRAQRIVPADSAPGVEDDIRVEYRGVREVRRTTRAATAFLSGSIYQTSVLTVEGYDRQGRLGKVEEYSAGEAEDPVATTYLYDVGGRLTRVTSSATVPTARTNVALWSNGGRVFTSQGFDETRYPAAAAVNGDRRGLGWGSGGGGWSDGTANAYPDWLEVRFAGPKTIEEVDVFTLQDAYDSPAEPTPDLRFRDGGLTSFIVQYWNKALNGGAGGWANIPNGGVTSNDKVWRRFIFAPLTTDRIRVYVTGSLGGYSRIVEVEAYEAGAGDTSVSLATQERSFTYDNRGFFLTETHPEVGVASAASGTISYAEYDSLGNRGTKRDGTSKLRFTYDAAGRLTLVRECLTVFTQCDLAGNSRPLKEYAYHGPNPSPTIFQLGKVRTATRHNYVPDVNNLAATTDVVITESFQYEGAGGRLSQRDLSSSAGMTFRQSFAYNDLGQLTSQAYPKCINNNCLNAAAARTVSYTYANGEMTSVAGYVSSIQYHPNGTVRSLAHTNLVTDHFDLDPDHLPRARQIYTLGSAADWSSGIYRYDGAGNIHRIGPDWFVYDAANRLVEGTALNSPYVGDRKRQRHVYDAFGNVLRRETVYNSGTAGETKVSANAPIISDRNRSADLAYDPSGNVTGTSAAPGMYAYDALNMMRTSSNGTGVGRIFLYTASDERVWTWDRPSGGAQPVETITLRGLDNEVLREYLIVNGNQSAANWAWQRDYVYARGRLVASESPTAGRLDYHGDHLGSPRLVTNAARQRVAYHQYLPFGAEATPSGQEDGRLKFTGHERDVPQFASPGLPLDYMHARYYATERATFMSPDPGRDFDPLQPQSWNLYAYTRNNPANATDPNGREKLQILSGGEAGKVAYFKTLIMEMYMRPSGAAALQAMVNDPKRNWILTEGENPQNPKSLEQANQMGGMGVTFGLLTPAQKTESGRDLHVIAMDQSAIQKFHEDPTGLTAFVHETGVHALDLVKGLSYQESKDKDKAVNGIREAHEKAKQIVGEGKTKTKVEAEKWFKENVIIN